MEIRVEDRNEQTRQEQCIVVFKLYSHRCLEQLTPPYKASLQNVCDEMCVYILMLTMKGNYYFINSINYDMRKKNLEKSHIRYMIKN